MGVVRAERHRLARDEGLARLASNAAAPELLGTSFIAATNTSLTTTECCSISNLMSRHGNTAVTHPHHHILVDVKVLRPMASSIAASRTPRTAWDDGHSESHRAAPSTHRLAMPRTMHAVYQPYGAKLKPHWPENAP